MEALKMAFADSKARREKKERDVNVTYIDQSLTGMKYKFDEREKQTLHSFRQLAGCQRCKY